MKRALALIALVPIIALARPFLSPDEISVHFIPVVLVIAAISLKDIQLVFFVLAGGALYDILVPVNFGLTPVVWMICVLLVRSQQRLIVQHPWLYAYLMTFVVSFLYLTSDKLLYSINYTVPLASHEAWLQLLRTAITNTLLLVSFRIALDLRKKILWMLNRRKYYEELDLTAYANR